MNSNRRRLGSAAVSALVTVGAFVVFLALARPARSAAAQGTAAPVPGAGKAAELASAVQMEPEALAKLMQVSKGQKPVILHVGFKNFYDQARIPGSDYAGPGSTADGLALLRKRVDALQHGQLIVLYCGCCPWDKCPNAKPAYEALHSMGFTNVKVVHVANNFGANWVDAGLPTTKAK